MSKVLILYAHPSQHRSEVNTKLVSAAQHMEGVTLVDLYARYPNHHIDINIEQQQLLEHDIIIFQFPLYWYSTPAILKEWQDLTLEHGWAYGSGGNKLHGKTFLCITSSGGKEEYYRQGGLNNFELRTLLTPLEQMARMTGMNYLPPFNLFGSRSAAEDGTLDSHCAQYINLLTCLRDEQLNLKPLEKAPLLKPALDELTGAGND